MYHLLSCSFIYANDVSYAQNAIAGGRQAGEGSLTRKLTAAASARPAALCSKDCCQSNSATAPTRYRPSCAETLYRKKQAQVTYTFHFFHCQSHTREDWHVRGYVHVWLLPLE
jgi:hypothetical protein